MSMTHTEWKHRMESLPYIDSQRQYSTEKRLLEAVGYREGWLERPVPQPDWFTVASAHARRLVAGETIRSLNGVALLSFDELQQAVREDKEWFPAALHAIQIRDDATAAKQLRNSMIGCAMNLIYQFREQLDPNIDTNGEPEDEEFMEHITRGDRAA